MSMTHSPHIKYLTPGNSVTPCICQVNVSSLSESAGLHPGDLLIAVNGEDVQHHRHKEDYSSASLGLRSTNQCQDSPSDCHHSESKNLLRTLPKFFNPDLFLFQKKFCIHEDAGVVEAVAVNAEVLVAEEEATRNRRRGGMIWREKCDRQLPVNQWIFLYV